MAKKPKVVGFTPERGRRVRKNAGGVHTGIIQQDTRPRTVQIGAAFFRLMEDVTSPTGVFWARRTNRLNSTLGAWTQVYNWDGLLNGAVAGYHALYLRVDGEWVIGSGDCIPQPCEHEGAIVVGDPPDGTVDVEYAGHTVSITSVTDLAASGLPAGLTMDTAGEITGTPTEAGTFYVTVTGLSGVDDCELTRIMVITIAEA